jgi:hypothetical protein
VFACAAADNNQKGFNDRISDTVQTNEAKKKPPGLAGGFSGILGVACTNTPLDPPAV